MSDSKLTVTAQIHGDNTVWLKIESFGVESDLGVYGPYDTRQSAEVAAREAVAHVARQMQIQKNRLMTGMIDV